MKILLTFILFLCFSLPLQAHDDEFPISVIITVDGMTCEVCAQTLEKKFSEKEAVAEVHTDLETKKITLTFKHDTYVSRLQIRKALECGGYDLVNIEYQYP